LGGALSIGSLAEARVNPVDALVVIGTPVRLNYSRTLFYREMWRTYFGSPSLGLLREMTAWQVRQSWRNMGYRSQHTIAEMFALLRPLEGIRQLKDVPLLLVYSRRDGVAPPEHAGALRGAAPHAELVESKKASHVMLTLIPEINSKIAGWLRETLAEERRQ
jgi:pimeloyl-ACP methyl ester carboxylesterase